MLTRFSLPTSPLVFAHPLLTVALVVLAITHGLARAGAEDPFDCRPPSANEIAAQCIERVLADTDRRLNEAYQAALAGASTRRQELVAEQRSWLKRRDTECGSATVVQDRARWLAVLAEQPDRARCVVRASVERTQLLLAKSAVGQPASGAYDVRSTQAFSRGKRYFEARIDARAIAQRGDADIRIGVREMESGAGLGETVHARRADLNSITQDSNALIRIDDLAQVTIGIALDLDAGRLYVRRNGRWLGGTPGSSGGSAVRTGRTYRAVVSSSVLLTPLLEAQLVHINFGSAPFELAPPSGYVPMELATASETETEAARTEATVALIGDVAGETRVQWVRRFWQWTRAARADRNPSLDVSGAFCDEQQSGPVWFLAGFSGGTPIRRVCRVPAGKHLLFNLIATLGEVAPGRTAACAEVIDNVKTMMRSSSGLHATLDGRPIGGLARMRQDTEGCFALKPADVRIGRMAFADGYWVMLPPLPAGEHVLRFGGQSGASGFLQDVTYQLQVEEAQAPRAEETLKPAVHCSFVGAASLPEDLIVIAAGAYSGRTLDFQIDSSGHQATQFDIALHADKPVALLLGSYEPTIWNISWTEKTRIVAVYATGYHRQVVAGLPKGTPVINASYEDKSPCGYQYFASNVEQLTWLNPKSRAVFGREVTRVYANHARGVVDVVETVRPKEAYVTSTDATPESFHDRSAPLAGTAGLDDAIRKGLIRSITQADIQQVRAAFEDHARSTAGPSDTIPPVAGLTSTPKPAVQYPQLGTHRTFVVLQAFTFPAGLYGGNLASFVVPKGVPLPTGNPGHSMVVDLNRLTCAGPLCKRD